MVFTFNSLSVKEIVSAHKRKPSRYKSCKKAKHALIKTSMPSIMLNYMMTMINIFIFDIFLTTFMMKNDSNDNDDGNSSDADECQQADNRIVVFGMQDPCGGKNLHFKVSHWANPTHLRQMEGQVDRCHPRKMGCKGRLPWDLQWHNHFVQPSRYIA